MQEGKDLEIIILAAGLGTRMRSGTPKVLQRVCGIPMLALLLRELDHGVTGLRAAGKLADATFNIVVGHGRSAVQNLVEDLRGSGKLETPAFFTEQERQLGTGHAVRLALARRGTAASLCAVVNGDLPLFTAECFSRFLEGHRKARSHASLASAVAAEAGHYGRVVRKRGKFTGVVEYKDATAAQRRIREFNGGVYLFDRTLLQEAISASGNRNAAGEYYLPDAFAFARRKRKPVLAFLFEDEEWLHGVNNMEELALAQGALYWRAARRWMAEGVFLHEPRHTYIAPTAILAAGCELGPFTSIHGDSRLSRGVRVGAHCELSDVTIGEGSVIRNSTVAEKSVIGSSCAVGPMAHLRPGTKLADGVRVGNFVEIKESELGAGTAAAHLSYVGDATIGAKVNLGCGFVTCNYDGVARDGRRKHRAVIGDGVFVGSDSQVVAPIEIAEGAYIASGSTVTESVSEKDSLVIARSRQVTKPGYARKYRKG